MASPMPEAALLIGEKPPAQVPVECRALAVEIGDHQVGPAVAVEVAASHAHARLVSAGGVAGHAGLMADFLELEVSQVAEQVIGRAVVGDEEVDAIIPVKVGGHDAQAAAVRIGETGRCRHIHESTAVVAKDMVARPARPCGARSRSGRRRDSGRARGFFGSQSM